MLSATMADITLRSTSSRWGAVTLTPRLAALGALRRAILQSEDDSPNPYEIAKWWCVLLDPLCQRAVRFPGTWSDVESASARLLPAGEQISHDACVQLARHARIYWSLTQPKRRAA